MHMHACIFVCRYVCACPFVCMLLCVRVCVCTHVLKLGVDTKCFPLLLSIVFFETRSLLKPGAQQLGYIAQPVLAAHLFYISHDLPLPALRSQESPIVPAY